ncbi:hypothetical protein GKZ89_12700 [Bacillus mangrovi]|uniref:Uncharacterized protein n=1 Tax=Metabacillus mangrovi TaxID=1491830 RepID=A0A7X2S6P7_9BACI|nr:hypothetical protein [Metabacillus mangrovi]MTH54263.1 hypothetical protein [Metabacillus mangrovi]
MLSKRKNVLVIFIAVLLFDFILILLNLNSYYVTFLQSTGVIMPVLVTILSMYLVAAAFNVRKFWIITGAFAALILIGWLSLKPIFFEYSYDKVQAPNGSPSLVIEHRTATLGETSHFYTFYRVTAIPIVMKKLNKDPVSIITRGTNDDSLTVLGVENSKWSDQKVVFSSPYEEKRVEISY